MVISKLITMEDTESAVAQRSRSVKEVMNCVKASGSAGYRNSLRPGESAKREEAV